MSPEGWGAAAAIVVSLVGSGGALWVAMVNRPKMNAEAQAASAGGETSVSADAREWAKDFRADAAEARDRARAAEARAEAAEARADATEENAEQFKRECSQRLDDQDRKIASFVAYTRVLQTRLITLGEPVDPPPANLSPPL